jgi:transaldolase
VLAEFARMGIDVDELAARLRQEGAGSFAKSWNELLGVIEAKSAALRRE